MRFGNWAKRSPFPRVPMLPPWPTAWYVLPKVNNSEAEEHLKKKREEDDNNCTPPLPAHAYKR